MWICLHEFKYYLLQVCSAFHILTVSSLVTNLTYLENQVSKYGNGSDNFTTNLNLSNSPLYHSYLTLCLPYMHTQAILLTTFIGGSGGGGHARHMPSPHGTKFFHFHIHFCQKAPTSEVHTHPNGSMPPLWEILDPPLTLDNYICSK